MGLGLIPLSDNMAQLFAYWLERQKDSISKNNTCDSLLHHAAREGEGGVRLSVSRALSASADAPMSPSEQ